MEYRIIQIHDDCIKEEVADELLELLDVGFFIYKEYKLTNHLILILAKEQKLTEEAKQAIRDKFEKFFLL